MREMQAQLQRDLAKERQLRRQYHNEVETLKGKIRVVCRLTDSGTPCLSTSQSTPPARGSCCVCCVQEMAFSAHPPPQTKVVVSIICCQLAGDVFMNCPRKNRSE